MPFDTTSAAWPVRCVTDRRRGTARTVWRVVLVMGVLSSVSAEAQLTREEALAAVYPDATVEAETVFLTEPQQARVAALATVDVSTPMVARYLATRDGASVGRAYVDTHVVRTKRESLLISLDDSGRVARIDVTAFLEPIEYHAPEPWLKQYERHTLADDLQIHRAIRPIAGATLTARAANDAVRRVLAIDLVLQADALDREDRR